MKKKNFFFFWSAGVVDFHPLGAQISGTKEKFKNPLGDPNHIDMSYQPLPHMATHHLWSGL